jgi:hypothetical protein
VWSECCITDNACNGSLLNGHIPSHTGSHSNLYTNGNSDCDKAPQSVGDQRDARS